MKPFLRAILLVAVALLIPAIPFLILGEAFEEQIVAWLRDTEVSQSTRFVLIVLVLATDIILPVPSSMASTYGGGVLGVWGATAASWLGMTAGAVIGFALARALGPRFAARLARQEDLDRMRALTGRVGPLALVITRALPILAEACVLLAGATGLGWKRFLVPVVLTNAVISLVYAACGHYFRELDALPVAVVVSGIVPLAAALLVRRWLNRLDQSREAGT